MAPRCNNSDNGYCMKSIRYLLRAFIKVSETPELVLQNTCQLASY